VELDVLARGEVTVASVILATDVRKLPKLGRRQHAVRHRDAEHRRVRLDVETVLQPQRPELVLGELTREESLRLAATLRHTFRDHPMIVTVVAIHSSLRTNISVTAAHRTAKEGLAIT